MDSQILEGLLEAGAESPGTDYKGPCAWNLGTFAKDILALSNVQDGGYIIVGVEETDTGFVRRGVTLEQKATFVLDEMRDQISLYADPHVKFLVEFLTDKGGLEFVVIKVAPFEEIPVLCRKTQYDLRAATLYYRNRNRRVESAPVSNSHDLRDILDRAAVKRMQRLLELGLAVQAGIGAPPGTLTAHTVKKQLDEELKGL